MDGDEDAKVVTERKRIERNRLFVAKLLDLDDAQITDKMLSFLLQDGVCEIFVSFITQLRDDDEEEGPETPRVARRPRRDEPPTEQLRRSYTATLLVTGDDASGAALEFVAKTAPTIIASIFDVFSPRSAGCVEHGIALLLHLLDEGAGGGADSMADAVGRHVAAHCGGCVGHLLDHIALPAAKDLLFRVVTCVEASAKTRWGLATALAEWRLLPQVAKRITHRALAPTDTTALAHAQDCGECLVGLVDLLSADASCGELLLQPLGHCPAELAHALVDALAPARPYLQRLAAAKVLRGLVGMTGRASVPARPGQGPPPHDSDDSEDDDSEPPRVANQAFSVALPLQGLLAARLPQIVDALYAPTNAEEAAADARAGAAAGAVRGGGGPGVAVVKGGSEGGGQVSASLLRLRLTSPSKIPNLITGGGGGITGGGGGQSSVRLVRAKSGAATPAPEASPSTAADAKDDGAASAAAPGAEAAEATAAAAPLSPGSGGAAPLPSAFSVQAGACVVRHPGGFTAPPLTLLRLTLATLIADLVDKEDGRWLPWLPVADTWRVFPALALNYPEADLFHCQLYRIVFRLLRVYSSAFTNPMPPPMESSTESSTEEAASSTKGGVPRAHWEAAEAHLRGLLQKARFLHHLVVHCRRDLEEEEEEEEEEKGIRHREAAGEEKGVKARGGNGNGGGEGMGGDRQGGGVPAVGTAQPSPSGGEPPVRLRRVRRKRVAGSVAPSAHALRLCNAFRLQAALLPPSTFLRAFLQSHAAWRAFLPELERRTLAAVAAPGLGFEVPLQEDSDDDDDDDEQEGMHQKPGRVCAGMKAPQETLQSRAADAASAEDAAAAVLGLPRDPSLAALLDGEGERGEGEEGCSVSDGEAGDDGGCGGGGGGEGDNTNSNGSAIRVAWVDTRPMDPGSDFAASLGFDPALCPAPWKPLANGPDSSSSSPDCKAKGRRGKARKRGNHKSGGGASSNPRASLSLPRSIQGPLA